MNVKPLLEEVSNVIAGTCTYGFSPMDALDDAAYNLIYEEICSKGSDPSDHDMDALVAVYLELASVTEDMLDKFLNDKEQFLCDECNWWTYPGESNHDGKCSECSSEEE